MEVPALSVVGSGRSGDERLAGGSGDSLLAVRSPRWRYQCGTHRRRFGCVTEQCGGLFRGRRGSGPGRTRARGRSRSRAAAPRSKVELGDVGVLLGGEAREHGLRECRAFLRGIERQPSLLQREPADVAVEGSVGVRGQLVEKPASRRHRGRRRGAAASPGRGRSATPSGRSPSDVAPGQSGSDRPPSPSCQVPRRLRLALAAASGRVARGADRASSAFSGIYRHRHAIRSLARCQPRIAFPQH